VAVEVELCAEIDGELTPVARTLTDENGKFAFRGVPLDRTLNFVAGANVDGVRYASEKFTLGPGRPSVRVRLGVRHSIADASPLVIRRHEIVIEPELGALHVTEAMLIDNPTAKTYVGRTTAGAPMPITFVLGIPTDFERLTFEEEFYGRNFTQIGGKVVASIPWEPGQRWVRFTYSARNEQTFRRWERRIDAPCERLTIRVVGEGAKAVDCSLPLVAATTKERRQFSFSSSSDTLAEDDVVWVTFGDMPVSWMAYARYGAVVVLIAAVVALGIWARFRRHERPSAADDRGSRPQPAAAKRRAA
jgi:hypothetical protein